MFAEACASLLHYPDALDVVHSLFTSEPGNSSNDADVLLIDNDQATGVEVTSLLNGMGYTCEVCPSYALGVERAIRGYQLGAFFSPSFFFL